MIIPAVAVTHAAYSIGVYIFILPYKNKSLPLPYAPSPAGERAIGFV